MKATGYDQGEDFAEPNWTISLKITNPAFIERATELALTAVNQQRPFSRGRSYKRISEARA